MRMPSFINPISVQEILVTRELTGMTTSEARNVMIKQRLVSYVTNQKLETKQLREILVYLIGEL